MNSIHKISATINARSKELSFSPDDLQQVYLRDGFICPDQDNASPHPAGGSQQVGYIRLTGAIHHNVSQAAPGSTHGAYQTMRVRDGSTNQEAQALIRFDLSSIPAGSTVISASLGLNTYFARDPEAPLLPHEDRHDRRRERRAGGEVDDAAERRTDRVAHERPVARVAVLEFLFEAEDGGPEAEAQFIGTQQITLR